MKKGMLFGTALAAALASSAMADPRAWVSAPSVKVFRQAFKQPDKIVFLLTFKNPGDDAARDVFVKSKVASFNIWHSTLKSLCGSALSDLNAREALAQVKSGTGAAALSVGAALTVNGSNAVPPMQAEPQPAILPDGALPIGPIPNSDDLSVSADDLKKIDQPFIIGCVTYHSGKSPEVHTTPFMGGMTVSEAGTVEVSQMYVVDPN